MQNPHKYRKKPIVIEAMLWDGEYETLYDVLWFTGIKEFYTTDKNEIPIHTSEGTMLASVGDYIIKGVNGEFYPCKLDVFEKTYEKVEEE